MKSVFSLPMKGFKVPYDKQKGKAIPPQKVYLSNKSKDKLIAKAITAKTRAFIGVILSLNNLRYYCVEYNDPCNAVPGKTSYYAQLDNIKQYADKVLSELYAIVDDEEERKFLIDLVICSSALSKEILDVVPSLRTEEQQDMFFTRFADLMVQILKETKETNEQDNTDK